MGFRDLRATVAKAVHRAMADPALLLRGSEEPVAVTARVFSKPMDVGELIGGGLSARAYATLSDAALHAIFLDPAVTPQKNDILSCVPGEAYRLVVQVKPDGPTIVWEVSQLTDLQAAGLPVPE